MDFDILGLDVDADLYDPREIKKWRGDNRDEPILDNVGIRKID